MFLSACWAGQGVLLKLWISTSLCHVGRSSVEPPGFVPHTFQLLPLGAAPHPRFIIRIKQTQVPLNLLRHLLWARVWSVCVPVLRAHRKNTYSALLGGSCKCHSDKALSPCVPTGSSPLVLCVIERGAVEPPGAIVDLPVALCNCITFYNMCFKLLLLGI